MALTAFSIDITLPLFGVMSADLGTPIERIPLTITFYMVSMGIGQFVFGALSDRFGRRGVLLFGLSLYIVGGVLSGFADSINALILARAVQGFGVAAPYILARAIIRDLYTGTELAQKMAVATGIFSLGPMLAPLIGALILELGGNWRWIFVFMTVYGISIMATLKFVVETNAQKNVSATQITTLISNAKTVLTDQQSRYFIIISCIIATSMLIIISTSASIYANTFNISGSAFAFYYAAHAVGIIVGQIANHHLIGKIGIVPTTLIATVVMFVSAVGISLYALSGFITPWGVSFLLAVFALGYLSVVANSTSMILQPHGSIVGFTAALQGTITMLCAGLLGSVLSVFVQNSIVIWGLVIACGPVVVFILLLRWQQLSKRQAIINPV